MDVADWNLIIGEGEVEGGGRRRDALSERGERGARMLIEISGWSKMDWAVVRSFVAVEARIFTEIGEIETSVG